jgi:hypothetical protein
MADEIMQDIDQPTDWIFDTEACSIIGHRRPILEAHLERWQGMPIASTIDSDRPNEDWLTELERAVCRTSEADFVERSRGRDIWLEEFLLPLARDLELVQIAETTTFHQPYRTGKFDRINPETGKLYRPPADQVVPGARALLQALPYHNRRVTALIEQQLCRDPEAAQRVVEAWRRCERQAGALARGVVLAYLAHSDIGLLINSPFLHTDALLFLETQRDLITDFFVPAVLPQLQADIVALARSWEASKLGGWCLRLLQEPVNSEYRRRIDRSIGTRQRSSVVQVLVAQHSYPEPEARALVEHLLHGGLRALIAYRCNSDNHSAAEERYERLQLQRLLCETYGALAEDDQAAIESLVFNLQAAIRISGVQFPLAALLKERLSSKHRIHVSRRFRFGLAAIIKRRNERRSRRKTALQQASRKESGRQPTPATQLIRIFAELSNLEESDAAARLRDLITYGAIGLLPRGQRLRCLDPRLISWLRLIRYGRLDGRVPWPRLMTQLDVYRRALGLPKPVSSLLAHAVFNAIRRPAFWHGGQGEATTRLRQRGTLVISGAPRLHERWLVISIASPVTLCDALGHPMGSGSHLVLVIEANGLLPLAVWPSVANPTLREVCLALYQAIWHPGAQNWPVKGIPEEILLSDELMVGQRDELDRAADYLLCDVLVQPRTKCVSRKLRALLRKFEGGGIASATKQLSLEERTPILVMRSLEQWIEKQFFLNHNPAPVWPEIAKHGVVMPGPDTPAAGWLLPLVGKARITTKGVEYEGRCYRMPFVAAMQEGSAPIRHAPLLMTGSEKHLTLNGVFVEAQRNGGTEPVLEYVTERG